MLPEIIQPTICFQNLEKIFEFDYSMLSRKIIKSNNDKKLRMSLRMSSLYIHLSKNKMKIMSNNKMSIYKLFCLFWFTPLLMNPTDLFFIFKYTCLFSPLMTTS